MKKKILVLVDVQNDFISGSLANKDAEMAIPNIIELINSNQWDYIFMTADTHNIDSYTNTSEGRHLPVIHCEYGTDGWNIDSRVMEAVNKSGIKNEILMKPRFGDITLPYRIANFIGTEEYDITLCGFCTDICVVSNALILKATTENEVYLKANCCAGTTSENHESALKVMKSCHINII